jgi:UDP-N-acetyl-D-mannosaminuronic acid transferase (WecB/TagA/CpsF family)
MQAAGLEWLHRLAREPSRLARRYLLADPVMLLALTAAAIRQKALR